VPAALRACLAWLLLLGQASAVVDGSGLPLQRRPHRRELPQAQSRIPRHELRVTKARSRSFSPAAPELAMEDLLGSCGFTLADLPETGAMWHTASSACSVLGKLDRLVFVGDSVTRQVRTSPASGAPSTAKLCAPSSNLVWGPLQQAWLPCCVEPVSQQHLHHAEPGRRAQLYEALVQLLRGDMPRGALRADAPADVVERCTCNEQANADCRIYTEAWPASLTWLKGAPLVSAELAPCPNAPRFTMQFFHTYAKWTHEAHSRDTMTLARPAYPGAPEPPPVACMSRTREQLGQSSACLGATRACEHNAPWSCWQLLPSLCCQVNQGSHAYCSFGSRTSGQRPPQGQMRSGACAGARHRMPAPQQPGVRGGRALARAVRGRGRPMGQDGGRLQRAAPHPAHARHRGPVRCAA